MSKHRKNAESGSVATDPGAEPSGSASSAPVPPADGKPVESKAQRFIRLANRRVNNALKHLAYVRNLSARSTYEYTEEQAKAICETLSEAVLQVEDGFKPGKMAKDLFKL